MIHDLIIIGGGPAGYHAAQLAGHKGLKTILFEKKFIGGVCLNEGCIPSKTLLYSAKLFDNALNGEKYGLTIAQAHLDHKKVIERKNKVVRTLVTGIRSGLKKAGVEIIESEAQIKGKIREGFEVSSSGGTHTAGKILIAAGSVPVIPPVKGIVEGIKNNFVITSGDVFRLETIPEKMVIIGAGIIGLEMASYLNSLGCKVTVIEMLPRIAGNIDIDIASILLNNYKKKGVVFKLSTRIIEIGEGYAVYEENGEINRIDINRVLVSAGRKADISGLGSENAGLITVNGAINTDESGMTNIDGIYAAGDVNGRSMLAHTAYREAEVCINNITGITDRMNYDFIPSVIYTNPEVAAAGESEESCKMKNIRYEAVNIPLRFSGRYLAENEMGDGICKLIVGLPVDGGQKRLLGFHMIGNYSSEIIYGLSMIMEKKMAIDEIKRMIFPHPTVSEIIKEGIFQIT